MTVGLKVPIVRGGDVMTIGVGGGVTTEVGGTLGEVGGLTLIGKVGSTPDAPGTKLSSSAGRRQHVPTRNLSTHGPSCSPSCLMHCHTNMHVPVSPMAFVHD